MIHAHHAALLLRRNRRELPGWMLMTKLIVLLCFVLFMGYSLTCQLLGQHFYEQESKYGPFAPDFPSNGGCEEDRHMAATYKAIELRYTFSIVEQIRYWNKDLLAEQPPCPKP